MPLASGMNYNYIGKLGQSYKVTDLTTLLSTGAQLVQYA